MKSSFVLFVMAIAMTLLLGGCLIPRSFPIYGGTGFYGNGMGVWSGQPMWGGGFNRGWGGYGRYRMGGGFQSVPVVAVPFNGYQQPMWGGGFQQPCWGSW